MSEPRCPVREHEIVFREIKEAIKEICEKHEEDLVTLSELHTEVAALKKSEEVRIEELKILYRVANSIETVGKEVEKVVGIVSKHTDQINVLQTSRNSKIAEYFDHAVKWLIIATVTLLLTALGFYIKNNMGG